MRARQPDRDGYAARDGVKLFYEVFGDDHDDGPTVLLAPTWSIVHSRFWKAQVPYLARHYRVVTFDGRGCGRSDRPTGGAAYSRHEFAGDTIAVLDASGTDTAILVGLSAGALWTLQVAADNPDRTEGLVCIAPAVPLGSALPERSAWSFDDRLDTTEGWAAYNRHNWLEGDYDGFLDFFFRRMFTEPHSTKQIEDCVGWGRQIEPATLVDTQDGFGTDSGLEPFPTVCKRVRCPVLVVHGSDDAVRAHSSGAALAELTGGSLVTIEGGGHGPMARDPVVINRLLKEFIDRVHPPRRRTTWTRALRRPKRALYLSSPIGLGHARRDVAIAAELRRHHPELHIDWLAQHPVTRVLEAEGEHVHPASRWLTSESAHIEDECAEHDLHAFQAIRRMDEILVNNFMVFHDVVDTEHYDLVIGDESWEVDYFLHENPELKRFAYAWMTDFVGWLPMPDGGVDEARLTADYNAEMIEQIARYPRVRDRAIFVGDPGDVVPQRFGADLPGIREWTQAHYDFAGYVTGFDPAALGERDELRQRLGFRGDERVCVVTVGGSGVGGHLLARVIASYPEARRLVPDLRMIVVAGPRIDPSTLPAHHGLEVHAFVPDLPRHLAACDLAVVQGGLTTCMELVATRRPFLYFPLRHHFEQNFHVRHRLERYRAGRHMDYESATPEVLAGAIAAEIGRETHYAPVEADGAARAATLLAELL